MNKAISLAALLTLGGCELTQSGDSDLAQLTGEINSLRTELRATNLELHELKRTTREADDKAAASLDYLSGSMNTLPSTIRETCQPERKDQCDEEVIRTVVSDGDKLVVGQQEYVWVDPPGVSLVAKVDTGAASSSLHAEQITEFERDGEDWVRFELTLEADTVTLERAVVRRVRVIQQADRSGSRRMVVRMRMRIGNVEDTFEFTLADRSHLNHPMLLGRNFLTDIALVDVAQEFVQPRVNP